MSEINTWPGVIVMQCINPITRSGTPQAFQVRGNFAACAENLPVDARKTLFMPVTKVRCASHAMRGWENERDQGEGLCLTKTDG